MKVGDKHKTGSDFSSMGDKVQKSNSYFNNQLIKDVEVQATIYNYTFEKFKCLNLSYLIALVLMRFLVYFSYHHWQSIFSVFTFHTEKKEHLLKLQNLTQS